MHFEKATPRGSNSNSGLLEFEPAEDVANSLPDNRSTEIICTNRYKRVDVPDIQLYSNMRESQSSTHPDSHPVEAYGVEDAINAASKTNLAPASRSRSSKCLQARSRYEISALQGLDREPIEAPSAKSDTRTGRSRHNRSRHNRSRPKARITHSEETWMDLGWTQARKQVCSSPVSWLPLVLLSLLSVSGSASAGHSMLLVSDSSIGTSSSASSSSSSSGTTSTTEQGSWIRQNLHRSAGLASSNDVEEPQTQPYSDPMTTTASLPPTTTPPVGSASWVPPPNYFTPPPPTPTCTSEKEVCLPVNYSKFQLPNKGNVTVVSIGFDGFDVRKIDDHEYTVEISCYFLTKWRDDRLLLHHDILKERDNPEEQWFPIDLEFVNKVWLPDVEVLNLKQFATLDVLSKLQGLWVSQHNNVLYVLATRVIFICAMSFDAFPLDVQTCLLQVGSFNFDNRKMVFDSYLLPAMPNNTKSILDYDVKITQLRPEATFFVPAETGNYSVTGFEMTLSRRMSHYMITYYLPSSLFVVVSWTSFLIPSEDIQGRMALLVTLFLVLVNIFNTTTTNSPKADGLNAMQSWVICCIFFVFGALFEYAIILLQMKVKTFRKVASSMQKDETCKLDMAVLIAFPVVFLIFNIAYWLAFHL